MIRIGTSGYNHRDWIGSFYPPEMGPGRYLARYAEEFDLCELNAATAPVTLWMNTGPELALSKVPLSVTAVAPGNRPVTDVVWLTVSADGVVAEAAPEPVPLPVQ